MSLYQPKPSSLHAVQREDGRWDIHDAFGYLDGPYASQGDCGAVIRTFLDQCAPIEFEDWMRECA